MQFCALCGNVIDSDPIALEGETFHKECLLIDDDVEPVVRVIQEQLRDLDKITANLYYAPDIPLIKMEKAIGKFADGVTEDRVVALYDCTLEQTAESGFLVSTAGFYSRHPVSFEKFSILYKDIEKVEKGIDDRTRETTRLVLTTPGGVVLLEGGIVPSLSLDVLARFLTRVIDAREKGLIDTTDSFVIMQDFDDGLKMPYAKIIMNMMHAKGHRLSTDAIEAIEVFMAQNQFPSPARIEARDYLIKPAEKVGHLIHEIENRSPKGSQKGLRVSLIKDLMRFSDLTTKNTPYTSNEFIGVLRGLFGMTKDQMDAIRMVIDNDLALLDMEQDDDDIVANAQRLSTKAAVSGMPVAAAYISGSAAGFLATTMVEGLGSLDLASTLQLGPLIKENGDRLADKVVVRQEEELIAKEILKENVDSRNFMVREKVHLHERAALNIAEDINIYINDLIRSLKGTGATKQTVENQAMKIKRVSNLMNGIMEKGKDMSAKIHSGG